MMQKRTLAATLLALSTMTGIAAPSRPANMTAARLMLAGDPALAVMPPAPWSADDPADSLYRRAREALNQGSYREAARVFAQIVERFPQSAYAGDALYWQAFAEYSLGERRSLVAALSALDAQRARYPRAATRGDADALAIRVRGALAKLGDPDAAEAVATRAGTVAKPCTTRGSTGESEDEDDERMAALNALMQMNAEQAIPILQQVLAKRDACSVSLREKALFLVSQKHTPETEYIILNAVQTDPSKEVRKKGVFWLGQVRSARAAEALEKILSSSDDEELREQAIFALMQQRTERGEAAVRAIAESSKEPNDLREKAVFWIGQNRSTANATFLRGLFSRLATAGGERNDELQQKILFSLSQMRGEGNDRWLMEVAADSKYSVDVRKQAIFGAGQIRVAPSELMALYGKVSDREVKEQLIWVISDRRDPAAIDFLMEIAKRDKDPEMRKKALFWLGQSQDPRVKQFLIDIINGE